MLVKEVKALVYRHERLAKILHTGEAYVSPAMRLLPGAKIDVSPGEDLRMS